MKKFVFIICAALCVFASCQKEADISVPEVGPMSLNASLSEITKVAVGPTGKATWNANDAITVYNTDGAPFVFTLTSGAGTGNGKFECATFSGTMGPVAVYPADFAGATPGTITIPAYFANGESVPAVMAGSVSGGNVTFKHIFGMMEFSFENLPAYACGLKVQAEGLQIAGTFSFDASTLGAVSATASSSDNSYIITFPYGTAYGDEEYVTLYAPLPVAEYGGKLKVSFVDGDEDVIEGTENAFIVPAASSVITAGKYIVMPAINVRYKVTRPANYRKVEGVKWATGNLMLGDGLSTTDTSCDLLTQEGFQAGWHIAAHQWSYINKAYAEKFAQDNHRMDLFNWGALGRAARFYELKYAILPTSGTADKDLKTPALEIAGRIFKKRSGTGIWIMQNVVEGDARFESQKNYSSSLSDLYGDIAFWASKGQYRMPTRAEIQKLWAGVSGCASAQSGYVMDGEVQVNGMLFTSTPSWSESTINIEKRLITDADLEAGVFLPLCGRGFATESGKRKINAQGLYWAGTFGDMDAKRTHCPSAFYITEKAITSSSFYYGTEETVDGNGTVTAESSGSVCAQAAIRPVVCE